MRIEIAVLLGCLVACHGQGTDTSEGDTDGSDTTDTQDTDDTHTDAPSLPKGAFQITWAGDGLTLSITGGEGDYQLGLAGTGPSQGGWYGEDCLEGEAGYAICHPASETGVHLATTSDAWEVQAGVSTLFTSNESSQITYAIWASGGGCVTWGNDPTYYTDEGCVETTR